MIDPLQDQHLTEHAELIAELLHNTHPVHRAELFKKIAEALTGSHPGSLTLAVMFERLALEYRTIVERREN